MENGRPEEGLREGLYVLGACFAIEIGWCRVSSEPLTLFDVGVEVAFFVVCGAIPALVLALFSGLGRGNARLSLVWSVVWGGAMLLLGVKRMLGSNVYIPGPDTLAWGFPEWALSLAVPFIGLAAGAWMSFARSQLVWFVASGCLLGVAAPCVTWILRDLAQPGLLIASLAAWCGAILAMWQVTWLRPSIAVLAAALGLSPFPSQLDLAPHWSERGPATQGPDVIMIVADTLRADAARSMQSYQRIARAGRDLSPAQASSSWTSPTMASVMTGMSAATHGVGTQWSGDAPKRTAIPTELPTLAEELRAAGYDTAAVLGYQPNVSEDLGFGRGFMHFDAAGSHSARASLMPSNNRRSIPHGVQGLRRLFMFSRWFIERTGGRARGTATALVDRAQAVLRARRDRPLFLWLHLMDVHLPYNRPDLVTEDPAQLQQLLHISRLAEGEWYSSPANRALLRRAYDSAVASMDVQLTRFLENLGPPGPRGRVLIMMSDHGEEFWEHDHFEHGHAYWQEVTGVPLAMAGIEVADGVGGPDVPASQLDIAPSVLLAAGVDVPAAMEGRPLQLVAGRDRTLMVKGLLYDDVVPAEAIAVRQNSLFLHQLPETQQLFDLARDPGEEDDLSVQHPELLDSFDREDLVARPPVRDAPTVELDREQREALKELGYMQ